MTKTHSGRERKIYLALYSDTPDSTFEAGGRRYHKLWYVYRIPKVSKGMPVSFIRINGVDLVYDPTAPMLIKGSMPNDARPVLEEEAIRLHSMNSHNFGIPDPTPEQITGKKPAMKEVWIVRNKTDRRIQTAWYDKANAEQQAEATQSEMLAEDFPEEECLYEVVGPVYIQDSV